MFFCPYYTMVEIVFVWKRWRCMCLKALEMPGIEPGAFHMQSERSTTELHPLTCGTRNSKQDDHFMYNAHRCSKWWAWYFKRARQSRGFLLVLKDSRVRFQQRANRRLIGCGHIGETRLETATIFVSRDSSVGRALDWRSKGPWFNPGFRHPGDCHVF